MSVTETSKDAFAENRQRLKGDCLSVMEAIEELGPIHDARTFEYLCQKESLKPKTQRRTWYPKDISARRNDLIMLGLIHSAGKFQGLWRDRKKTYIFWRATGCTRPIPPGWEYVPPKPLDPKKIAPRASQAGKFLRSLPRKSKSHPKTQTGQGLLFAGGIRV